MSIWADIHRRSNGKSARKEDVANKRAELEEELTRKRLIKKVFYDQYRGTYYVGYDSNGKYFTYPDYNSNDDEEDYSNGWSM